jgi:hypothetical protein
MPSPGVVRTTRGDVLVGHSDAATGIHPCLPCEKKSCLDAKSEVLDRAGCH